MNVWIRPRRAGLMAAPARSISPKLARANPQITEFLASFAISLTASKSPSDAIGNPASIISTPISSRSSATCSFSSYVIVAPGHCSPSRSVVSNIITGSKAGTLGVSDVPVMDLIPCRDVLAGRDLLDHLPLETLRSVANSSSPERRSRLQTGPLGPGACKRELT